MAGLARLESSTLGAEIQATDGNTSYRTITEVEHLELNQFSDG